MRREWTIWLGFTVVVLAAVVFVVTRNDRDDSKLSAGTSVPTTVAVPSTVTTRPHQPTTPTTPSSSTSVVPATSPPTTARQTTSGTSATTVPATVVVTQPPVTAPATTSPPVTEPPLKPAFDDGFYRINVDLPPGTYRSEGGLYCTWDRFSSSAYPPSASNLIASGYSTGDPISVAIAPTDGAFRTSGCEIWLGQ
jgi:cytoskeletal protein RodZ